MELRAEVFAVRRGAEEVLIDFVRLNARQPHPPIAGDPVKLSQEGASGRNGGSAGLAPRRLDAVVADVDPADDDFLVAPVDQAAGLRPRSVPGAALQPRANLGDDAVRAAEQAAVLDLEIGPPDGRRSG